MGCFTCFKVMMVIFNLIIFLGGLVLLALGIWACVGGAGSLGILGYFSSQFVNVGFLWIGLGLLLMLIGLLGFFAAQKESKCFLLMFFCIILIIFVVGVVVVVVVMGYSSIAWHILRRWAMHALKEKYGRDPVLTKIWNTTMTEMNCCGFTNHTDFVDSHFVEHRGYLPPSCCKRYQMMPANGTAICRHRQAYMDKVEGCFEAVMERLKGNANVVGGVAAGIGAVEVAAMVVSMYLYCRLDIRVTYKS